MDLNLPWTGTTIEDSCSLGAIGAIEEVPLRLLACLGLGAEQDLSHAHVFENIAALAQAGGFLGPCSLTLDRPAYRAYEDAVSFVHSRTPSEPSVINASVISSVQGQYGDHPLTEKTRGSRLWISPLMSIYWHFDLAAVAERNRILGQLALTDTFPDALVAFLAARGQLPLRSARKIPLP